MPCASPRPCTQVSAHAGHKLPLVSTMSRSIGTSGVPLRIAWPEVLAPLQHRRTPACRARTVSASAPGVQCPQCEAPATGHDMQRCRALLPGTYLEVGGTAKAMSPLLFSYNWSNRDVASRAARRGQGGMQRSAGAAETTVLCKGPTKALPCPLGRLVTRYRYRRPITELITRACAGSLRCSVRHYMCPTRGPRRVQLRSAGLGTGTGTALTLDGADCQAFGCAPTTPHACAPTWAAMQRTVHGLVSPRSQHLAKKPAHSATCSPRATAPERCRTVAFRL